MPSLNIKRYQSIPSIPESMWKNPLHFIAFGLGSGAAPVAPGTFGTLMAIPFYLMLAPLQPAYYLISVFVIAIASILICHKVSKDIHIHDHQGMCLDEFVGFFVTMFDAPRGWSWIILGFLLFRLFDIWKPLGIRWVDRHVPGGIGMILDDVLAGVLACFILHIFMWF